MVCQIGLLGALELELSGGINTLSWQPDKTAAYGSGKFEPFPYILGNMSIRGEIPRAWGFSVNIERDNIFQNTIDFRLLTRTDYFGFEFGVFAGITDDFSIPDIGFIGNMEITWPNVMFFELSSSSTVGSHFEMLGDNFRDSAGVKLGFWLPFAIPAFSLNSKSLTEFTDGQNPRTATLTRYQFDADFPFAKTSPVNMNLNGGYQILKKVYSTDADEPSSLDELRSFYAGFELLFKVSRPFHFFIGAEMPFVIEPVAPMTISDDIMFKAWGGFKIIFY